MLQIITFSLQKSYIFLRNPADTRCRKEVSDDVLGTEKFYLQACNESHSITKEVIMVSSVSSTSSYLLQMLLQTTQQQQRKDELFSKVDNDSSGTIDKTEFSALAKKLSTDSSSSIDADSVFTTYDANNDGTLSKDELDKFMKENASPPADTSAGAMSQMGMQQAVDSMFNSIDSNGDGEVSSSEMTAYLKSLSTSNDTTSTDAGTSSSDTSASSAISSLFAQYASNSDGTMNEADFEKLIQENSPPPPPPPSNGSGDTNQVTTQVMDDLFNSIDTNGDGEVSSSEMTAYLKSLLTSNDTTSTDAGTSSSDTSTSSAVSSLFAQYASNSDGTMSETDFEKLMQENSPPPPPQMQSAMSAYAVNTNTEQLSDMFDFLKIQFSGASSFSITA